jgi:hypothetical protein
VSKYRLMAGASIAAISTFILKNDIAGLQAFLDTDGVQVKSIYVFSWYRYMSNSPPFFVNLKSFSH